MMRITFSDAGKRFNRDWIFRKFNYEFLPAENYAITGPNGSGKSTLLQIICSSMAVNTGKVEWQFGDKFLDAEQVYKHLTIAAPYLEVIEEMTATEFLTFHGSFKAYQPGLKIPQIISIIGLQKSANKQVRYFSSGMKQRLKLAQAIFADVPLLLLDEPCTNLDTAGIDLYLQLIATYAAGKTIIVSSNDEVEYGFCEKVISIMKYK